MVKLDKQHEKYLSILHDCKGIITMATQKMGVSRQAHYKWVKEVEGFAERVEEVTEAAIDHVENKLYNLIDNNDTTATIFYLKTKAKKRGYVEKQEVEMSGNLNLTIEDQLLELVEDDETNE